MRELLKPAKPEARQRERDGGFTLIEVMISILITLIVMASVFALLTRGQKAFQREPEIADLQQSARTVLEMVSRDVLQAGGGLPPEYPAFSAVRGGDNNPGDLLEIIGTFQAAGDVYLDPEVVRGAAGNVLEMEGLTTNFEVGDLVVVFNDAAMESGTLPQWAMGWVTGVVDNVAGCSWAPNCANVIVDFGAVPAAYSSTTDAPINWGSFAQGAGLPSPRLARVSVVAYSTVQDDPTRYSGPPPLVLLREVDFSGQPQAVGYVEDFQIRYTVGVTAPVEQDNPPNPMNDIVPPNPITAENMISGVRITVAARSVTAGMEGATEGGAGRQDDFIRKTFSTNVSPRNITGSIDARVLAGLPAP